MSKIGSLLALYFLVFSFSVSAQFTGNDLGNDRPVVPDHRERNLLIPGLPALPPFDLPHQTTYNLLVELARENNLIINWSIYRSPDQTKELYKQIFYTCPGCITPQFYLYILNLCPDCIPTEPSPWIGNDKPYPFPLPSDHDPNGTIHINEGCMQTLIAAGLCSSRESCYEFIIQTGIGTRCLE